jgi:hypothetical protein
MFVGMEALRVYKSSLVLALRTGIVCSARSMTDVHDGIQSVGLKYTYVRLSCSFLFSMTI